MRALSLLSAFFISMTVAAAQPKPPTPALVGATETLKLTAPTGFIDDVVAADDQRIAYVVADAASKVELHVVTLADKQEKVIDIASITLRPLSITFVGNRALIVGALENASQIAALVELADKDKKPAGTVVYKVDAATHISVISQAGKPRIAVHRAVAVKDGKRHEIDILAVENGKRVIAGRGLELDATGGNKKLEFRVNHWSDGMTRAIGIKGGDWDKKNDTRLPDVEATFDLVTGKYIDQTKITDLFEQRRRFQVLAELGDRSDFLRMAWDNSAVQVWHAGKFRAVEIDQPLVTYDSKSLQGVVGADGSAWILLKVDPVNVEAIARKKTDPEYLDVFKVGTDTKAVRKFRVLATAVRHRFGVVGDKVWLIERNNGFDRGGKSLVIYQLP